MSADCCEQCGAAYERCMHSWRPLCHHCWIGLCKRARPEPAPWTEFAANDPVAEEAARRRNDAPMETSGQ